ncbi:hypothetical protein [Kribbella sp. ALI-6-A]|uniref:hypothetical protein n=1 Tax=Kribbella sp. ALI-6-A TaxID=1933817 RepID=UPI00143DE388|nr:hypothetical protein [Kribbella sp. ALI-6-A]
MAKPTISRAVQVLAAGLAGLTALAALVVLEAPLCPPGSETCRADEWSATARAYLTK